MIIRLIITDIMCSNCAFSSGLINVRISIRNPVLIKQKLLVLTVENLNTNQNMST